MGFTYQTELMSEANTVSIIGTNTLGLARAKVKYWTSEILENLGLSMAEVKEYRKCINIVSEKIDIFLDKNPEYGV